MAWRTLVLAALVSAVVAVGAPLAPVSALQSCLDKKCHRHNQCLVQCDRCDTETPILEGNCTI